tara:strand:- start:1413 stop:1967 length:555 start_codon:yes stop_codon:yes gene_type:complete
MSGSQDARTRDCFGPNCYIESGNPESSDFSPEAAAIKMSNDNAANFILAHHHSNAGGAGITRLQTEAELLIEAGAKDNPSTESLSIFSHGGDIQINSTQKSIGIKASSTLTLAADKIILKANDIQIGDSDKHGTKEIRLNATRIQVDGKKGNLPQHLKLSWGAGISFGPGGFVGQAISDKFFGK